MEERWDKMTPEEREKFQTGMRRWCRKPEPETPATTEPKLD